MFICIYFLIFVFVVPVSCAALSPRSVLSFLFLTLCLSLGFTSCFCVFGSVAIVFPSHHWLHMNLMSVPCQRHFEFPLLFCQSDNVTYDIVELKRLLLLCDLCFL